MSRKDKFHDHVREALEKDGWEITHDPYILTLVDEEEKTEVIRSIWALKAF